MSFELITCFWLIASSITIFLMLLALKLNERNDDEK